jgi:Protein of unknown function (DUF1214)
MLTIFNRVMVLLILIISSSISALHAEDISHKNDWHAYVEGLPALQDEFVKLLRDPDDPALRQELYKFMYSNLSWGYWFRMYQDESYTDFWPMFNQSYPLGFANPDDTYYQALIDDEGVYKISGFRGTTYIVDVQIGSGALGTWGTGHLGPTKRNFELDKLVTIHSDGSFEFILSRERPEGYKGDWLPLDEGAGFVWIRQIAWDWEKEQDGRFAIERLDVPARKPRESAERLAERMSAMSQFVHDWTIQQLRWNEWVGEPLPVNNVRLYDFSKGGGLKKQRYIQGIFDIKPDEALILETELPKECRYWMFHLADELASALNWLHNQVSINGFYAKLDSDGKFRAVISQQDPGVANWLDPSGYKRGIVVGRWKECTSYPTPTVKKVKVVDVLNHLPEDTAMVTPEERDASIRRMRKASQLRRRW